MIDKVLAEYQKAGIADMRYIDYQLEYYMGAVAVIEACEDQGLKCAVRKFFLQVREKPS